MEKKILRKVILALILIETVVLLYLAIQSYPSPVPVPPGTFLRSGDLDHIFGYAVYAFLWTLYLRPQKRMVLVPFLIAAGFGLFTETLQYFLPTRFFDPIDLLDNVVGSVIGVVVGLAVNRKRNASF